MDRLSGEEVLRVNRAIDSDVHKLQILSWLPQSRLDELASALDLTGEGDAARSVRGLALAEELHQAVVQDEGTPETTERSGLQTRVRQHVREVCRAFLQSPAATRALQQFARRGAGGDGSHAAERSASMMRIAELLSTQMRSRNVRMAETVQERRDRQRMEEQVRKRAATAEAQAGELRTALAAAKQLRKVELERLFQQLKALDRELEVVVDAMRVDELQFQQADSNMRTTTETRHAERITRMGALQHEVVAERAKQQDTWQSLETDMVKRKVRLEQQLDGLMREYDERMRQLQARLWEQKGLHAREASQLAKLVAYYEPVSAWAAAPASLAAQQDPPLAKLARACHLSDARHRQH